MRNYRIMKKDERLGFWHNFFYEFGLVFLIVFVNSYGLISIYNKLLKTDFSVGRISFYIIVFLVTSSVVSAVLVYFTRARIYSRTLQQICKAAQAVAKGDFSVRLNVYNNKKHKTELDILKEDFNTMVVCLSSVEGMQNDFVADVSHEIKTPLSVIQGYADLLASGRGDKEACDEYIKLMTAEIHKLNDLVANILMLNKMGNRGIVKKEKFSLDEQIRCCVLGFEEKIEEKNINIKIDLPEMVVVSEQYPLELVWNNLISNAVKYCNTNGTITIKLSCKNNIATVLVADTGIGIDKETQKHIFDKFYQGDTSHATEGNGLGLALVKKIADGMGGKVKVKSSLNNGCELCFSFPYEQ